MRKWFSVLTVFGLLLGLMVAPASANQTPQTFTVALKGDAISGEALAAIAAAGGTVVNQIEEIGVLEVTATNPGTFLKALVKSNLVDSVGPTRFYTLPTIDEPLANDGTSPVPANDPSKYTWGIDRVTNNGAAWNITTGTKDVVVGIIDSGLDLNHPDLVANIVPGSKTFVPGTTDVWDQNSHGTHVAGTIAANGVIKGVAPNVGIRSYRVFGTGGAAQTWITDAIIAAANDGVDVINMSLGGDRVLGQYYYVDPATGERTRLGNDHADNVAYFRAIRYAINKGVTVVVAAGNDAWDLAKRGQLTAEYQKVLDIDYGGVYQIQGATMDVPAQIPGVITVSATGGGFGTADRLAYYSNYGTGVINVAAPGGDIGPSYPINGKLDTDYYKYYTLSTVPTYTQCVTPKRLFGNCNYGFKVGTSMATPHVTGVVALYISQQYALTGQKPAPSQVAAALTQSAEDLGKPGYDGFFGHGMANAYNLLTAK